MFINNRRFKNEDFIVEEKTEYVNDYITGLPIMNVNTEEVRNLNKDISSIIKPVDFSFNPNCDAYEIFTGFDTSTTSKYLESTLVEAGIGIPIVHDKYSFCHGRSTTSINHNNTAIYLNRNTEFDKLLLEELKNIIPNFIDNFLSGILDSELLDETGNVLIDSIYDDQILDDYQMLIQAMYLTKYIASSKQKDLSKIEYSPVVKKLYKYNGNI